MAVRSTMAALISQVRLLINDPAGGSSTFADQDIQDVLDMTRQNVRYLSLAPAPTYSGSTIVYLDYYSDLGGWEDDATFWQYRVTQVTPSASEPIVGHWTFAQTTLPPVFVNGKLYDIYRAAADLLERWAARWVLSYNMSVDGQTLQRGQVATALQALAKTYRMKQRAHSINLLLTDLTMTRGMSGNDSSGASLEASLAPTEIDYIGSGDGR